MPSDLRYFDRLVGVPPTKTNAERTLSLDVLTSHVRTLVQMERPMKDFESVFLAFVSSNDPGNRRFDGVAT